MISSEGVTVLWSGPLGGQADRLVPSGLRFRDSAGASAWPRFQAPGGSRRPVSSGSLSWNSGQQLGPLRGSRGPQARQGLHPPATPGCRCEQRCPERELQERLVGTGTGGRTTAAQDRPGSGGCGPGAVPGLGPDALSLPGYCVASGEWLHCATSASRLSSWSAGGGGGRRRQRVSCTNTSAHTCSSDLAGLSSRLHEIRGPPSNTKDLCHHRMATRHHILKDAF